MAKAKGEFWKLLGSVLWNFRFVILIVVVFLLFSSLIAFYLGVHSALEAFNRTLQDNEKLPSEEILVFLISAIDEFLLGIVLIIIALGIYELFISKLHLSKNHAAKWLEFESLEELKAVLTKVIVIILMVFFFKSVVGMKFDTPLSTLYLAIGVILIALANYLTQKNIREVPNEKAKNNPGN